MLLQRYDPILSKRFYRTPWWRELALAFFLLICLMVGGTSSRLSLRPHDFLFFEFFIKDGLLPMVLVCLLWFVQLQKGTPERLAEFRFLHSQPLTQRQLALHFLMQDFRRYFWMPGVTIILLFSLLAYAPLSHILRACALVMVFYAGLTVANPVLHLALPLRRFGILSRLHPLLVFLIVFFYDTGVTALVFADGALSGFSYWLALAAMIVWCGASLFYFQRLFGKWCATNGAYRTMATVRGADVISTTNWQKWHWRLSPLLYKNILRLAREKSAFVTLLTAVFILCGYLVSRNNARLDDFLAILYAVTLIYAVLFAYKSQSYFSADEESTRLVYALPITKRAFYFSVFIPTGVWLILIVSIFAVLALFAGARWAAAVFWLKAAAVGLGFLVAALNTAFGAYPDIKTAQNRFFLWALAVLAGLALLYGYRYLIFFVLVTGTFFRPARRKLYFP